MAAFRLPQAVCRGLPFRLGWPYCVLCVVGPLWEERRSPAQREPTSVWLSNTRGRNGVLVLHSFIHSEHLLGASTWEIKRQAQAPPVELPVRRGA